MYRQAPWRPKESCVKGCSLPICPFSKICLGEEMCVHTWENLEIYQIWTVNQANQQDWPKGARTLHERKGGLDSRIYRGQVDSSKEEPGYQDEGLLHFPSHSPVGWRLVFPHFPKQRQLSQFSWNPLFNPLFTSILNVEYKINIVKDK